MAAHCTYQKKEVFLNSTAMEATNEVGNESKIQSIGFGTTEVETTLKGVGQKFVLEIVLYVPDMMLNLVSISKAPKTSIAL